MNQLKLIDEQMSKVIIFFFFHATSLLFEKCYISRTPSNSNKSFEIE